METWVFDLINQCFITVKTQTADININRHTPVNPAALLQTLTYFLVVNLRNSLRKGRFFFVLNFAPKEISI